MDGAKVGGGIYSYKAAMDTHCHPAFATTPTLYLGGLMNRIANGILGILHGDRKVIVLSDNGIIKGKVYCRESRVADYIKDMQKISRSEVKFTIAPDTSE